MRAHRIERLSVRDFRNLVSADVAPGPHFNVIAGENGAGKSSLLEAIYYLGALRSFRGAKTDDMIALGESGSTIQARVVGGPAPQTFRADLGRAQARRLTMDGKRPRSVSTWQASLQAVIFHPGDLELSSGSPDARRTFLDRILEQMDPTYGSTLAVYQKALRSRNRLLKKDGVDVRSIRAYDEILSSAGAVVGQTRARVVVDLAPLAEKALHEVIGEELPVRIAYKPRVEPTIDAMQEALERSFRKDLARGFTAEGPHADDLSLHVVDRAPARHHASQGQHRAIVLALKVAELEVLRWRTGRVPILLLDDVTSELDRTRNRRFFEILSLLGGQVFLTTTHPEFILLETDRTDFTVESGTVRAGSA